MIQTWNQNFNCPKTTICGGLFLYQEYCAFKCRNYIFAVICNETDTPKKVVQTKARKRYFTAMPIHNS